MTTTQRRTVGGPPTTAPRAFGVLALVLAGLLVLNTLLGPIVAGVIDYDISPSLLNHSLASRS